MIGGAKPELVPSGQRLMDLMLEAKLLPFGPKIGEVLAPGPLERLPP
jgi:hypothetical protein